VLVDTDQPIDDADGEDEEHHPAEPAFTRKRPDDAGDGQHRGEQHGAVHRPLVKRRPPVEEQHLKADERERGRDEEQIETLEVPARPVVHQRCSLRAAGSAAPFATSASVSRIASTVVPTR
jgi:hypothetical protein